MSTTLIKGGRVVLPHAAVQTDLLIEHETIAAIGNFPTDQADKVIDAKGMIVLPGGVDAHIHFNDSFMNALSVHDFDSGTLAAAHGGTTTVIDFAEQRRDGGLMEALNEKHRQAKGKALIDWASHVVITRFDQATLDEIPAVVEAGAPSIKCYMTYRQDGLMINLEQLTRIQEVLRDEGGMLLVHAEDDAMLEANKAALLSQGKTQAYYHASARPPQVEDRAIKGVIAMLKQVGGRLFVVHLASPKGMELIGRARARGLDISAETCIHYLVHTHDMLKREDGIKWICSPALRSKKIQQEIWQGVTDGRIESVSTDDAAFDWRAKLMGKDRFDMCPNGIPGIEVRMSLMYSEGVAKGRFDLPRMAELCSTAPARRFGLYPQKGTILPGSDADLVFLDPSESWTMGQDTLHMATDWCGYEGIPVTGRIKKVLSRGVLVIDQGRRVAEFGRGKFVHRSLKPLPKSPAKPQTPEHETARKPIYKSIDPAMVKTDLEPLLDFKPEGMSLDTLQKLLDKHLLPNLVDYSHPGFQSLYNFKLEPGAAVGAKMALMHNQGVTNWQVSPGGVMLEELCCQRLCQLLGMAPGAGATFMYSGTYANQQALYLSLHKKAEKQGFNLSQKGLTGFKDPRRLAMICSEEAHFSMQHTLRMMGLGEVCLFPVPVDQRRRMDLDALDKALDSIRGVRDVFCVVSTAGTSSIGSIDPVLQVAERCRELDTWHHVDAAYGLIYKLLPEMAHYFDGVEQADSVIWDPHKQFGVPIPSSLIFVRDARDLERMAIYSRYYNRKGETQPNPGLKSAPSTRPLAALPVVSSILYLGLDGVRERLRRPLRLVHKAVEYVESQPDLELVLKPDMTIFCVRLHPEGVGEEDLNELHKRLYKEVLVRAERSVSMTEIGGKSALRFLLLNPELDFSDVVETFDYLRGLAHNIEL
jgi:dihydropyrimidinase